MATIRRNQTVRSNMTRCHRSKLLSGAENGIIHSLIEKDCVSLVTTVVELYLTENPAHSNWVKEGTGVLCLVQNSKNEYVFHLYSLEREEMMWWCPLDRNCGYRSDMSYFHMFRGQKCVVGLNFANEAEARIIREVIRNYVKKPEIDSKFVVQKPKRTPTLPRKNKKGGKSQILEISNPINFKHIAHVSFDEKSFNNSAENKLLTEIFKRAGVTEAQLSDEETRQFMVKFVQKKQSRKKYRAPPPPQTPPSVSPSSNQRSPFKNVPTRQSPLPPVKQQFSFGDGGHATTAAPPPPPPLPVPQQEVHEEEMVSSFITPEPAIPDGRSAFLESIRQGSTLRSVKKRDIRPVNDEELFKDDIAAALSKAIRVRERALQNNDSFSESDVDSDDWDDDV